MRTIRHESNTSSHNGHHHVVTLLDDFIVEISVEDSSVYHQCLVMELLVALSDETF